uniref:WD_REPEATS_REGION domain-containing protein n=1 Tax=Strongyloides stercoralis TaxID=6248 RepID=A0A0K0ESI4_STRER
MKNPASNEQLQRFMSKMECQAISDDDDEDDISNKGDLISIDKESTKEKNISPKKLKTPEIFEPLSDNGEIIDNTKDDEVYDCETKERPQSLNSVVYEEPELFMGTQIPLSYGICSSMENFLRLKMRTNILKNLYECRKVSFYSGIVNSLCFSIDGRFIFTSDDSNVGRVIDIHSWKTKRIVSFNKYGIYNGQFLQHNYDIIHPSYKINYSLRQYSLEYNKYIRFYHGHENKITKLSLSPAGTFFMTSSTDGTIRLWDNRVPNSCSTINGFANPKISYDATGNYIGVIDETYVVKFFDIRTYNRGILKTFVINDENLNENNRVRDIQFSPNGKNFILPTNGCTFGSYDVITGGKIANYESINNWGYSHYSVEFSPCGSVIFVSCDNEINIYNVNNGFLHKTLISQHCRSISQMKFFNNAMMLAIGGDGVSLWTPDYAKIEKFKNEERIRDQVKYNNFVNHLKESAKKNNKSNNGNEIYNILKPLYINTEENYPSIEYFYNNNETNVEIKEEIEEDVTIKKDAHIKNIENCNEDEINEIKHIENNINVLGHKNKNKKIKKVFCKVKVKKEEQKIFEDVDMVSDDDEEEFEEVEFDEEVNECEYKKEDKSITVIS